jgi:hypothetical protein
MHEVICPDCGHQFHDTDRCLVCRGVATVIATPEHAAKTKIAGSETSFCKGPAPEPTLLPSIRNRHWSLKRPTTLILAAAIVLTAVALIVPKVQETRAKAIYVQSTNNLKNIGLAFHSFLDMKKRLPFNGTVTANAGDDTSGSWAFQILPFLDQKPVFDRPSTIVGVVAYMCPGRGRHDTCENGAWTDYFINPWLNDHLNGIVDAPDAHRTPAGITDGVSNTIMLGQGSVDPDLYGSVFAIVQSVDIFKGGNPAMARRSTTNQADKSGDTGLNWGGPFSQGCLFGMGDATVRMFPYTVTGGVITNGQAPGLQCNCGGTDSWGSTIGPFLTPRGGEVCDCPDT